jgi:hypothetical protein
MSAMRGDLTLSSIGKIFGNITTLEREHHRSLITDFYRCNPTIPVPRVLYVFSSWSDLSNNPLLTEDDCVFVDGGILKADLDVGKAILINDGGIREGSISCGRFHADGGITEGSVTERLRQGTA